MARHSNEILRFALIGAEDRLRQIAAEAHLIFRSFPQLRTRNAAGGVSTFFSAGTAPVSGPIVDGAVGSKKTIGHGERRGRRKMSAEARKRISDAQKARWAKQKAERAGDQSIRSRSTKKK